MSDIIDTAHAYDWAYDLFQIIGHSPKLNVEKRLKRLRALAPPAAEFAVTAAADTGAAVSQADIGDYPTHDLESHDANAGGATLTPWSAVDDDGDGTPVVWIFKKKRLIVVSVIGLLTALALIQLNTSRHAPPAPPPPMPEVASISPPTPAAQPNAQTVRVSGRGFRAGVRVVLEIPGGGSSILSQIQDLTDTSFAVVGAPLMVEGRYALSVENSDTSKSNLFVFTVSPSPRRENQPGTKPVDGDATPGVVTAASKPSTAIAVPATPIMTAASNGFRYDLESCTASGTTVRCVFAVTNQEDDRELMILGSARHRDGAAGDFAALNAGLPGSRAIDDAGNNATMREARLANYDLFGGTLVAGARTRLVVVFEGITASAQTLAVLDLGSRIGNRGDTFGIQFRDVPLRR